MALSPSNGWVLIDVGGLSVSLKTLSGAAGTGSGFARSNDVVFQARQGDMFRVHLSGDTRVDFTGGAANFLQVETEVRKGGASARELHETGSIHWLDMEGATFAIQPFHSKATYVALESGAISFRAHLEWGATGTVATFQIRNLVLEVDHYRPSVASVPPVGVFPTGSIEEAA